MPVYRRSLPASLADLADTQQIKWNSDLTLVRDASNALAQRNGASPQVFRVYNTYINGANYERGMVRWNGNTFQVGTDVSAGTGSPRGIAFTINGTERWLIGTNNHLTPYADNTLDLGTATLKPRTSYTNKIAVTDGIAAPSAIAGHAVIYVDSADGDLKVIFGDGTIKTLSTDS